MVRNSAVFMKAEIYTDNTRPIPSIQALREHYFFLWVIFTSLGHSNKMYFDLIPLLQAEVKVFKKAKNICELAHTNI